MAVSNLKLQNIMKIINYKLVIIFLAFTAVLALVFIYGFNGKFRILNSKPVASFDECVAAGNAVMESYPRQCRANGELFVEVLPNNYEDNETGISINIPEGFKVEKQSDTTIFILKDVDVIGMGPANFIYISRVPEQLRNTDEGNIYNYSPARVKMLLDLKNTGDSVNFSEDMPQMADWFTYTYVSDDTISAMNFKSYENTKPWEFPGGTSERRLIHDSGSEIYILGYYTGGDSVSEEAAIDPRTAFSIIKTFRPL